MVADLLTSSKIGATIDIPVPKDPKFDNPVWQETFKKVLPKLMQIICVTDPVRGMKTINSLKELAQTPNLSPFMPAFKTWDEYLDARIDDIAWPLVLPLPIRYIISGSNQADNLQICLCMCRFWG